MLSALLSLAVAGISASTSASQVPTLDVIPPAIERSEVPTCLQFTPTHFAARSHSEVDQWLVFENAEGGMRRVHRLAPHARVLFPIVEGSAKGVSVEVLCWSGAGALVASGALDCDVDIPRTVFLTHASGHLSGWLSTLGGKVLSKVATDRSTEPSQIAGRLERAATHVPVPAPAEHRKRDKSRPLERKKLPPI